MALSASEFVFEQKLSTKIVQVCFLLTLGIAVGLYGFEIWHDASWQIRIALLAVVGFVPLGIADTILRSIRFSNGEFRIRSRLGRKSCVYIKDVLGFSRDSHGKVRIHFSDRTIINLFTNEGDTQLFYEVLKTEAPNKEKLQ
jgi:hypothetical protein